MTSNATFLRRMGDSRPNLLALKEYKERLETVENLKSMGKIESALKEAEKLNKEVKNTFDMFYMSLDSIIALEKVVKDADVLEADLGDLSKLQESEALLMEGKFENAMEIADENREEISKLLKKHKDAKYQVDMAMEKIQEAKNWGFSVFEAERSLQSAKEALKNHDFAKAVTKSMESKEKASTIRERHRRSLELIQKANNEMEKFKEKGAKSSEMEEIVKEAEFEFDRGDYTASEEKIGRFFEIIKRSNSGE
ncbi:MAG: hypothetical protein JSV09_15860 [Thermoplasmata archaeon]|nr:MAG: hypothetical protein JSV09_15860 [Thermoplasmata archaeon]